MWVCLVATYLLYMDGVCAAHLPCLLINRTTSQIECLQFQLNPIIWRRIEHEFTALLMNVTNKPILELSASPLLLLSARSFSLFVCLNRRSRHLFPLNSWDIINNQFNGFSKIYCNITAWQFYSYAKSLELTNNRRMHNWLHRLTKWSF